MANYYRKLALLLIAIAAATGCAVRKVQDVPIQKTLSIALQSACDCEGHKPAMGVVIRYIDPVTKKERTIYEIESDHSTENGKPTLVKEERQNLIPPGTAFDSTVTAVTADKQLRVIRFIKTSSGAGPGKVETVVENLTDGPLEVISVWNAFECGIPCPVGCLNCMPGTVNGKQVIGFGERNGREILQPKMRSRPSSYALAPR